MRLIAKGVGDAQADVMAVMIGVIPLLHGLMIRSDGVVDPIPAIVDGLVCDMLAEGIVSDQRQPEAIIEQGIPQGKREVAVAVSLSHVAVVCQPMLVAYIQQKGMSMVQIPVGTSCQTAPPSIEVGLVVRMNIVVMAVALCRCHQMR